MCQRRRICGLISTHCALKLFSRNETPRTTLLVYTHHHLRDLVNTIHVPSCRLLVPHKRWTDCAWRSGLRVDKQERVSAVVHVEICAWAFLFSS